MRSLLEPVELEIDRLTRDQKQLDLRPEQDCYVLVTNDRVKRYIRRGANRNNGTSQRDCFILRRDGSIEGAIDWDYDHISRVEARPIDPKPLVLRGGVFTTFANRMKQEVGYNYWSRNIEITRSNTEVDGLTHYVVGETAVGHPYSGFISVSNCANVTLRNCFATGHKIYKTIGAADTPVSMGSYDYSAGSVVNFTMINCRMNHITDRTRWGVIGTNFCKNIVLEDCTLSRMDTHMGVSGTYIIRRCTLGYAGLNAIGRGILTVEDSTLYGSSLISFRGDYGSTWEGDVVIRNCRWIPSRGKYHHPAPDQRQQRRQARLRLPLLHAPRGHDRRPPRRRLEPSRRLPGHVPLQRPRRPQPRRPPLPLQLDRKSHDQIPHHRQQPHPTHLPKPRIFQSRSRHWPKEIAKTIGVSSIFDVQPFLLPTNHHHLALAPSSLV